MPNNSSGFRARIEHVDTDAYGVVHFSRYTSLMETAALEFLADREAGLSTFDHAEVEVVVAELRVRYECSAVYRDQLVADVRVAHVGAARFLLAVELFREEEDDTPTRLVSGTLMFAVVEPRSRRPVPLPAAARLTLKGIASDVQDGRHSSQLGTNGRSPAR